MFNCAFNFRKKKNVIETWYQQNTLSLQNLEFLKTDTTKRAQICHMFDEGTWQPALKNHSNAWMRVKNRVRTTVRMSTRGLAATFVMILRMFKPWAKLNLLGDVWFVMMCP